VLSIRRVSLRRADLSTPAPRALVDLVEHATSHANPVPDFLAACAAEEGKLQRLKSDLVETIADLVREEGELSAALRTEKTALRDIDARLKTQLRRVQQSLLVSLQSLLERRAEIERHALLADQIVRMQSLRDEPTSEGASSTADPSDYTDHAPAYALDELAKEIEGHLREWQFSEPCPST
jgi:hypothetical protein